MTNAELIAKLQQLPPDADVQAYSVAERCFDDARCVMHDKLLNTIAVVPSTVQDMARSFHNSGVSHRIILL